MRIFCLVFYMTNFLNCICIQSGGQGHRKKQSCSICFKTYFLLFKVMLTHTGCSNVIAPGRYSAFITMLLKTSTILHDVYSNVKVNVILTEKNVGL